MKNLPPRARLVLAGVATCCIFLLAIKFQILLLGLSIALTYLLLRPLLSERVFDSRLYQVAVSTFAYFVVLQTVILSVWLFDHNFPLHLTLYLTLAVLLLSHVWARRFRGNDASRTVLRKEFSFNFADGASLLVSLLLVFVTVVGPIRNARADNHGQVPVYTLLNLIDTSLDDGSHLSFFNDRLQLDRGVLYHTDLTDYVVSGNAISSYPPGWHSANAVSVKAIDPGITVGGNSAVAYLLTKIFWYALMIYLFVRFILALYRLYVPQEHVVPSLLWLCGAAVFFSFYMLIEQFREGFYSFVPELISLLVAAPLLIQLGTDKTVEDKQARTLAPLALAAAGAALSWVFALPALLLALFVGFIYASSLGHLWANLRRVLHEILLLAPVFTLVVLSVGCQMLLLTAAGSRSFKAGINDPGGISIHNAWYFAFILIGAILFYVWAKKERKGIEELTILLFGLFGFATFIYLFQVATLGHIEYYTYKTLNTAIIIALPVAIIGWLYLLKLLQAKQTVLTGLALCGLFLVGLPLALGLNPTNGSTVGYVHGTRAFSDKELKFIFNNLNARAKTNFRYRTEDVIFYIPGPDEYGHNVVGTNLLRSIQRIDSCDSTVFADLATSDQQIILGDVKKCDVPKAHLTIVTSTDNLALLTSQIQDDGLSGRVSAMAL